MDKMRILMILMMVFGTSTFTACGQKTDVPAKVKNHILSKIPYYEKS